MFYILFYREKYGIIVLKFNIITQSVGYTAKDKTCQGIVGEKGMGGESPAEDCRCVHPKFLYSSVKTGHWETEKAEYENARLLHNRIWGESQDLL